jgi:ribosomal-protein-alanine N-acetyltransferase
MIREGQPDDWERLRRIQAATLSDPWPELLELALGEPSLVLVADGGDSGPIAYALVVPDDAVAYVAEFAVAPDQQGEGVGSVLMGALLDRLTEDGVETVRLTARADEESVQAFYRGHGFAVVETVADHYDHGDGLLFERSLS